MKKDSTFLGNTRLRSGQTLYQIDGKTQKVTVAEIITNNLGKNKKVIVAPNCSYVPAMNHKVALKKYLKLINA
ncbi:virion structural protein [Cellulophaga phage phiST]|nr:virion structural protein [Cellulophaga phage phiST]AGH56752.1 hypothetical protein CGPG_00053 [Cellulophaga phage phiST]